MPTVVRMISKYNYSSRNGNSVKYIVLHYTANKGDTAKNNVDYFYGGDRSVIRRIILYHKSQIKLS